MAVGFESDSQMMSAVYKSNRLDTYQTLIIVTRSNYHYICAHSLSQPRLQ